MSRAVAWWGSSRVTAPLERGASRGWLALSADPGDAASALLTQRRRQEELDRKRMIPWIPWLFVLGLGLSALGLATSIARFEEEGSPTGRVVFLALTALFFAWTVALWVTPRRLEPRIVPYFARQLAEYGGDSSKAFARGHGLYRDIAALDRLARSEGARALSEFGFADDHYDQHVRWHPARDGLATVEALRKRLGADLPAAGDVALDLEALVLALRLADGQDVPFSLALRLRKDDVQAVSSQEERQGRFW